MTFGVALAAYASIGLIFGALSARTGKLTNLQVGLNWLLWPVYPVMFVWELGKLLLVVVGWGCNKLFAPAKPTQERPKY